MLSAQRPSKEKGFAGRLKSLLLGCRQIKLAKDISPQSAAMASQSVGAK
jgi:hypothetical protein